MTPFVVNDETADRARSVADDLVSAGDTVIADGLRAPARNYKMVVGAYGWWRLVNRTSRAVLALVDEGFSAPEVAPLMRNIFNHAYALNWLIDNGEPAVDAVLSAGAASREQLYKKLKATGWAIADEYKDLMSQQAPEPVRTPDQETLHKKLVHEIGNVHDMLDRYGSSDLYPVYSHLSSLSHTSVDTASAYLAQADDGSAQIRPSAVDLGPADVIQLAIALIQVGHVFSPLLDGDPLRSTVDRAIADLGLENVQLLPIRTK
ncbi:DUF5677 domain-containing protein [Streptomyces europaeiscabiei]|uniref:DUF5677 domain-containing protein n=1 Tax=Streptomyces europaeiscabiei TaxID=146819 RepID=UPI0029BECB47|nr:DUF5677 domain-containing protein [Streptomyces europaeiscabiei]MDX3589093.1 DUF5677 domain-containing protein [Streptomyces europaeiscabiei]